MVVTPQVSGWPLVPLCELGNPLTVTALLASLASIYVPITVQTSLLDLNFSAVSLSQSHVYLSGISGAMAWLYDLAFKFRS